MPWPNNYQRTNVDESWYSDVVHSFGVFGKLRVVTITFQVENQYPAGGMLELHITGQGTELKNIMFLLKLPNLTFASLPNFPDMR